MRSIVLILALLLAGCADGPVGIDLDYSMASGKATIKHVLKQGIKVSHKWAF